MQMQKNRLHLDFSIPDTVGRRDFVETYIQQPQFQKYPLTPDELETISNYILWGKELDGRNLVQKKVVQIDTRNSTWTREEPYESLDALLEIPTFNENTILQPHEAHYKTPKETFSREDALRNAPAALQKTLRELFQQIDELEYTINMYELGTGKRKNPPREELVERLSPSTQENLKEIANSLNQFSYLKKRHLLVELRRSQYTLKDSYSPTLFLDRPRETQLLIDPPRFGTDIDVRPLGLNTGNRYAQLVFQDLNKLEIPKKEEDLSLISSFLWRPVDQNAQFFDFRELEHVYQLFQQFFEVKEEVDRENDDLDDSLKALLNTLYYYIKLADLTEIQREILDKKVKRCKNAEVRKYINEKYGTTYTENYISTIFRQKIIKAINEAAAYHLSVMENIFFEEEFKKCSCCGRLLLKNPYNFVRKTRAKDGYTNRCKLCDRLVRKQKKGETK